MDLYILDKTLKTIGLVDTASSVIWTERYYSPGDFEIYIKATAGNIGLFQKERYVKRVDSGMVGIIEKISRNTNSETGNYLIITGRCLKSLLDRRVIAQQTNLTGNVEDAMRQLITQNVISPADSARKIDNIHLADPVGFTETIEMQTTGENLMDKIVKICTAYGIGWRVNLVENHLEIEFYRGADRSYAQSDNPYVVFSPDFDNLLSAEVFEDISSLKNVAVVAGEGEGTARKTTTVGTATGLDRREMFVDARDISSNDGEISSSEYTELLKGRGDEVLAEAVELIGFTGMAETSLTYKLNEDFFLGDTVVAADEYGTTANARILEIIECEDENGYSIIPTFEEWR